MPATSPLIKTKLHVPPMRPDLVARPQLIRRLDQGQCHALTLISAPPGFGKTTLVTTWLAQQPLPVAWYSLDERDNDPARFLAYLLAALDCAQVAEGSAEFRRLRTRRLLPPESLMTLLCNGIAAISREFVLVLDDYHVVESVAIHRMVEFLLEQPSLPLHLVMVTRADPPFSLARLRARNQLVEVRTADLRFSLDETSEFLRSQRDLRLDGEQVAALQASVEGWIAALQLAVLSLRGRGTDAAVGLTFAGDHRFVVDYLADQVLQRLPPEIVTFLLQISIVDQITASLADAVTGRSDSAAVLAQIEQANLFLLPLDDARQWFRYHRLFAEFLRSRLGATDPEGVPELHRRASVWYERRGAMADAIDHLLAAGDLDRAAQRIEQHARAVLQRGETNTLSKWLAALPPGLIAERPQLAIMSAWSEILVLRPDVARLHLRQVKERLALSGGGAEGTPVAGEIALLEYAATVLAEPNRSCAPGGVFPVVAPHGDVAPGSLVDFQASLYHLMSGDVAAGRQALLRAVDAARQAGDLLITTFATTHLAELCACQGHLREALDLDTRLLQQLESEAADAPVLAMVYSGLGAVYRERGELETAHRLLEQAITLAGRVSEMLVFDALIGLARTCFSQGDSAGTDAALRRVEELASKTVAVEIDDEMVALHRARLDVARGNLPAAERWMQARGLTVENWDTRGDLYSLAEIEATTLARVLLARNECRRALELLERLQAVVERLGRNGVLIELLVLQALARHGAGQPARALTDLQRALDLAEPERYVRVFLDEGEPMLKLLAKLAPKVRYAAELLGTAGALATRPLSPLLEPLSTRELEVLRLIAQGRTNQEIADRLCIAVTTVKTHVNNVFGKLGVERRTQAVARARELQIL